MNSNLNLGACGICCESCGLYNHGVCSGCQKTQKHVDFLKSIGSNCEVLECAVKNKVNVCPKDCHKFPCGNFDEGPFSKAWIEKYKKKINS